MCEGITRVSFSAGGERRAVWGLFWGGRESGARTATSHEREEGGEREEMWGWTATINHRGTQRGAAGDRGRNARTWVMIGAHEEDWPDTIGQSGGRQGGGRGPKVKKKNKRLTEHDSRFCVSVLGLRAEVDEGGV